jgi:hypothetical protein
MSRLRSILVVLALCGCSSPEVVARRAPPPDRSEQRDPKPSGEFFWVQGHWILDAKADEFAWQPGHWERERTNRIWIPGYWAPRGDVWVWHEEIWEERGR